MKLEETKLLEKIGMIKISRLGYWVCYHEVFSGYNLGNLDIVGAKCGYFPDYKIETLGVEIKVSRQDYFCTKQKKVDNNLSNKPENVGVNLRYFLTPSGLIKKEELYNGWGLMEWNDKNVKIIVPAPKTEVDNSLVLYHMARNALYLFHEHKTNLYNGYNLKNYQDVCQKEYKLKKI